MDAIAAKPSNTKIIVNLRVVPFIRHLPLSLISISQEFAFQEGFACVGESAEAAELAGSFAGSGVE